MANSASPAAVTGAESASFLTKFVSTSNQASEVEFAVCECCGLKEECTPAYIARVRERFYGRWICGLCAEAVKDELCRSNTLIGMEEALDAHMSFCRQFKSSAHTNPAVHLVGVMRRLLRRSLDSPRALRSTPSSPRVKEDVGHSGLARTSSCFSTLAR
eukprot:Gb_05755 [translate_table: standard]